MVGGLFGKQKHVSSSDIAEAREVYTQLREKLAEAKRTRQYIEKFRDNPEVYQKLLKEYSELGKEVKRLVPEAKKYAEVLK